MELSDLYGDVYNFRKINTADLFAIDYDEIAKIQLHHFQKRFDELKAKIPALRRLVDDVEVNAIASLDDLSALSFPHTIYKSYAVSWVDNARYDLMTNWLQSFTSHDLSKVDVSDCVALDDWMSRLEAQTPLRPSTSSGTSGKISIFPRSTLEEADFLENTVRLLDPYKDEHVVDFRSGQYPFFNAWPARTGRHSLPINFRLLTDHIYSGREDMIVTLDDKFMGAEELWLTGKLRRAETLGEVPELTDREKIIKQRLSTTPEESERLWDRFIERTVIAQKGKTVVLFAAWIQCYQLALACKQRGIKIEWSPKSVIFGGGGTKGFTFPDGWMDVLAESFGDLYPNSFREGYGTTETTASMTCCSAEGHLHPLPWGIQHVADPDTGQPLPRKGIQKGRLLTFDLLADSYWSGTAGGDEVTINWDGGCKCGRQGPYFYNDIQRFSDTRGGDDKITCSRTPQAFQKLEEFLAQ